MLKIFNPMYETIITLNEYDCEVLHDSEFEMLCKNFRSNLKKVFYGTIFISEIQDDDNLMQKYEYIIRPAIIEYVFQKITTVWDVSYQIGNKILNFRKAKKNENKYDVLQKEFDERSINQFDFKWYKEFNMLRNRLTHGGLNIITFYDDKRIKFQIYDNDVEEVVEYNDYYNDGQRLIIFADYYFTYYTVLLHNYLCNFFKFINSQVVLNNINSNCENIDSFFKEQHKYFPLIKLEQFNSLINDMNKNKDENEKYDFYYR